MKSRIELNLEKQNTIDREKQLAKTKKIIKKIIISLILIFIFFFFFFLYITKIGTSSLIIKEKVIESKKIPSSFDGIKIIHFGDLHYENQNLLRKTVKAITIRKPDIIIFTGDLLKDELTPNNRKNIVEELKKLNATLGKYAVLGEKDNIESSSILLDCDFNILDNTSDLIYNESNEPINLIGLNTNNKEINYQETFKNYNETIYNIAIFHQPDYIDNFINTYKVDLALAGHTHLGEVNIPFFNNLVGLTSNNKYNKSYYKIKNTEFYITEGLGTTKYNVRFNARPSINFFRLRKTS